MVSNDAVAFDHPESGGQTKTWRRRVWHEFSRRRMRIVRPMLTPRCITTAFGACGILVLWMGLVLADSSEGLAELVHDYTDDAVNASTGVGYFDIEVDMDVQPPIWVSYELQGFYQNHRRHKESISFDQWGEEASKLSDAQLQKHCDPRSDGGDGRPLYPCGLVAQSVFNDSYVLQVRAPHATAPWERLEVDSSPSTISWPSDLRGRFRNLDPEKEHVGTRQQNQVAMDMWILRQFPPVTCEQVVISEEHPYNPVTVATRTRTWENALGLAEQVDISDCRGHKGEQPICSFQRNGEPFHCAGNYRLVRQENWGIESGHFINWVRIAGMPNFRKLWGKIDIPLQAGSTVRVHFRDSFPVKERRARKALVIYTGSVFGGGRGDILA